MRLVFDPRVGLKRFITSLKNLFNPTRGSNTSRITNSLPLFSLLNHTLNFHNWRLICVYPDVEMGVDPLNDSSEFDNFPSASTSVISVNKDNSLQIPHEKRFKCIHCRNASVQPSFNNLNELLRHFKDARCFIGFSEDQLLPTTCQRIRCKFRPLPRN